MIKASYSRRVVACCAILAAIMRRACVQIAHKCSKKKCRNAEAATKHATFCMYDKDVARTTSGAIARRPDRCCHGAVIRRSSGVSNVAFV